MAPHTLVCAGGTSGVAGETSVEKSFNQIEHRGFCLFANLCTLFGFIYKVTSVFIKNERFSMSFGNFRAFRKSGHHVVCQPCSVPRLDIATTTTKL